MANSTVHVGSGKQKRRARWPFIVALAVTVVLAGGAGVFLRYLQNKHTGQATFDPTPPPPDSVAEAQSLLGQGKVTEADQYVKDQLKNQSLPSDERWQLYIEQGRIAYEKQDYTEASEAYTNAWAIHESYDLARNLGATWQQLGNNQKAIEFYRKAIELNPQDNPTREADNNVLNQMIEMLEGGGQ
ncbi:MAG: tetratricopeptide repeat protein [Candidatus Saccharimonadales bacterium]